MDTFVRVEQIVHEEEDRNRRFSCRLQQRVRVAISSHR